MRPSTTRSESALARFVFSDIQLFETIETTSFEMQTEGPNLQMSGQRQEEVEHRQTEGRGSQADCDGSTPCNARALAKRR